MRRISHPLALAHQTILDVPPPDLVRIAAATGFDGVTLRVRPAHPHQKPYPMQPGSPMMRETSAALADTGLFLQDVEVYRLKPDFDIGDFRSYMDVGVALGSRYAGVVSDDDDESRVADHLGLMAEVSDGIGVKIYFEFMVYVGIKTIAQAERIIRNTGRWDAIGLMVDPLHLSRSGGRPADVAKVDPAMLHYAQLCDAAAEVLPDDQGGAPMEARDFRLPPGEGALPLLELLRILPPAIPLGVEAPCTPLRAQLGDMAFARHVFDAARRLLMQLEDGSGGAL